MSNGGTSTIIHPTQLRLSGIKLRVEETQSIGDSASTLVLPSGQITVLLGPNGVGKTRLLAIAAGLLREEAIAAIHYGDQAMWEKRSFGRQRRRQEALLAYSYACQSPEEQLFLRTVESELRYALLPYHLTEEEASSRIRDALSAVGWDQAWLQRDPYGMSGGERRRAALASTLAAPAPWLLLDEPTAGLDAEAHERLASILLQERSSGRGVLLISHERDWGLALADQVLLLSPSGEIRQCTREMLLEHPEWWDEAGLEIPPWLSMAQAAWKAGVPGDQIWQANDLAQAIAALPAEALGSFYASVRREEERIPVAMPSSPESPQRPALRASRLSTFDPRAVWLSYIIFSTGMITVQHWFGLAWAGMFTLIAVVLGRIPLLRWRGTIIGFAYFTVTASLLSGITAAGGHSGWNTDAFLLTLHSFTRTWLVLLLGLGLPMVMTPLRLRRSLEQLIVFGGKGRLIAQRFVLTVTLILRFIPQLLGEWERFAGITVARGKDVRKSPAALIKRLRDTTLPFLLSMFRMGDEVATALESRGIGREANPTMAEKLRWRQQDSWLLAGVLLATGWLVAGKLAGWF